MLDGDAAGRAGRRFQTPLASLDAFQGWADKFLATPPSGIDDRYVVLEAEPRRLSRRVELLGKYSDYSAHGFAADTTKAWVMVTATLR